MHQLKNFRTTAKTRFAITGAPRFLDLEGGPLFPDGLEYLIGLSGWDATGAEWFKSFWAHDHDEERRSFEAAVDLMDDHLKRHPAHIYHYAPYEPTAFKRLAYRYGDARGRARRLAAPVKVRRSLRGCVAGNPRSESRYSLKNLELFYAPAREDEVFGRGQPCGLRAVAPDASA
jgi:predicted RecB family nuclease